MTKQNRRVWNNISKRSNNLEKSLKYYFTMLFITHYRLNNPLG